MQNRFSKNFISERSGDLSSGLYGSNTPTVGQSGQAWVLLSLIGLGLFGGIGSRLYYLQRSEERRVGKEC